MILALAIAAFAAQAPSLLPELPRGWRFERLDFPLSFAPELDYRGFEELAFAPGMFDAASPSYFSYALAIRLEGEHEVDEAFLESFLATYYRGLCKAVAAGKEPALDLSKVTAKVERDGERFVAKVRAFDPFVTLGPLELALELRAHPGPGTTELLGLASPRSEDAPIWGELAAIEEQWLAARPAPVFFNHLFVVPDAETYAAIAGSDFLREELAVSEERETVRSDMSYAGVYFYGERTYFELLPPVAAPGLDAGRTGIAFGVERAGAAESLAARLAEREIRSFPAERTREVDGEPVPWFRILGIEMPRRESLLTLFSMEYDARFLAGFHPDLSPAGGITRHAVLARYSAKLRRDPEASLLRDVTAVRLALGAPERERFLETCRAFGHLVEEDGERRLCVGPGVRFVVSPSDGPGGVTGFDLSLRRPVEREPLRLGRATVRFDGRSASFDFDTD